MIFPIVSVSDVYQEVGLHFGSRHDTETIRQRLNQAYSIEEQIDEADNWQTSEAREYERWRNIVAAVFDDVTDFEGCFRALYQRFAQPSAWRCADGTPALLRRLAEEGYRLGLASNYDQRLRQVVPGLAGLAGVEEILISSEIGWRKPSPCFFAAVCEQWQLPPAQILFVGDDERNDIEGGAAAGLLTLHVPPSVATMGWCDLFKPLTHPSFKETNHHGDIHNYQTRGGSV